MNEMIKKGLGFGVTSAVITTLGIIVGMHSSTDMKEAILGAILVIAFADSMADGLGIYFSERSRENCKPSEPWIAFASAFLGKFIFALTFTVPIFIFHNLHTGVIIDLVYGLILLVTFTYFNAKEKKENIMLMISFHVVLAVVVITAAHFIGNWINSVI